MWVLVLYLVTIIISYHVGMVAHRKKVRDFVSSRWSSVESYNRHDEGYNEAMGTIYNSLTTVKFRLPFEKKGSL